MKKRKNFTENKREEIYGISNKSIGYVYNNIKEKTLFLTKNTKENVIDKRRIILCDYKTFLFFYPLIKNRDKIVIIVDSYVIFKNIDNLKIIDHKTHPKNLNRFIENKKIKKFSVKTKTKTQKEIIQLLIEEYTKYSFLYYFNNLTLKSNKKQKLKNNIIKLIFSDIKIEEYKRNVKDINMNKNMEKRMLEFLSVKQGKNFILALKNIKFSLEKDRTVDYNFIEKEYQVDTYELKYCTELYKKLFYNKNKTGLVNSVRSKQKITA